jgi:hypothetical protein
MDFRRDQSGDQETDSIITKGQSWREEQDRPIARKE